MTVSEQGKTLIKEFEALRLTRYADAAGKDTIGWGHLILPTDKIGNTITKAQAETLLNADLMTAERAVLNAFTVPLNQNQFNALVSFQFNTGNRIFSSTGLRSLINGNGRPIDIYNFWTTHYISADGVTLPGLVRRRKAEADLYLGYTEKKKK